MAMVWHKGWKIVLLLVCAVAHCNGAPSYSIRDLGDLGGGLSRAFDVNIAGDVVGMGYLPNSSTNHAFLWHNGTMTDLGTFNADGSGASGAYGINDLGQVVGFANKAGVGTHAFLWSGGLMTDLGVLSGFGANSAAYVLNNNGTAVGTSGQSMPNGRVTVYAGGQAQDLGISSAPTGINDAGQIIGGYGQYGPPFLYQNGSFADLGASAHGAYSISSDGHVAGTLLVRIASGYESHAAIYFNGAWTDLGAVFGSRDEPTLAINDVGQLVGEVLIEQRNALAPFLYDNGTFYDLNSLIPTGSGWLVQEAMAINNNGQIVGDGEIGGHLHALS